MGRMVETILTDFSSGMSKVFRKLQGNLYFAHKSTIIPEVFFVHILITELSMPYHYWNNGL